MTDAASGSMSSGHDFLDFSDHQNEYLYDGNGNLTKDLNRGVSQIQYNVLNLPIRIDIKNPLSEARNEYLYRSDGEKSRVIHRWNPNYSVAPVIGSGISESSLTMSDTTDYVGTFEYEGGVLKRIETENGYIEDGRYVYYVRDHLGSIRRLSSHRVGSEGLNYYPYGMLWRSEGALSEQRYLYTGKEYDRMHGLNLYDYGARFYDPSLGRFTTVDPMAEKYYSLSPYVYCGNNPTRFIDPSGMSYGEPEKSKRQLISEMLEVMKDLVEGFTYQLGVHPAQLQSEDAKIREDATQKREHALQVMNTVNESMLSPIPFGEIAYKKATDQEISSHSMVWEVAGILPIGKIGKVAKGGVQGFNSFSAFKRAMGPAGPGKAWHHIVEQTPGNIAKFGPEAIHNTGNMMKLPHGAGSIHMKVTGHYNSLMPGTSMRVRDYVNTLNYQQQYQYGLDVLKRFGW